MVEISRSMKARKNNAKGHMFESYINAACSYYKRTGQAVIEKIPEPFRTTATERDGTFSGRFTSNAKPDYIGTLKNGRSICFEAKYTTTDKMQQSVLTDEQWKSLEEHYQMGAVVGICIGIKDVFAFIPWEVWKEMKALYGRKHLKIIDLEIYKVPFNGCCLFLENINKGTSL